MNRLNRRCNWRKNEEADVVCEMDEYSMTGALRYKEADAVGGIDEASTTIYYCIKK